MGMCFFMWCKGEFVGEDEFGNKYYKECGGKKCWVVYNGLVEVLFILLGWYGWIYYCVDMVLFEESYKVKFWQQFYEVNYIGMFGVYCLYGFILIFEKCLEVIGDYQVWSLGQQVLKCLVDCRFVFGGFFLLVW